MAKRLTLSERYAKICFRLYIGFILHLKRLGTENQDGSITIPKIYYNKLMRDTEREYERLPVEERDKFKIHASYFLSEKRRSDKETKKTDPRVNEVKQKFIEYCENIRGFTPEINHAIDGSIIKKKLQTYTVEEITDCFDWFMSTSDYDGFGCSIKTVLANGIFNKWLEVR